MATTAAAAAGPIRKKRNFKALALDVGVGQSPGGSMSAAADSGGGLPVATRLAPAPGAGKKKPPMMDLSKSRRPAANANASGNEPGSSAGTITINGPSSAPATGTPSSRPTYQVQLQQKLAALDINGGASGDGKERGEKIELRNEDLKEICELGQGNGGSVKQVEHVPTGKKMAKKIVLIDAKPAVRKQILRELQFMDNCHSQYIVSFYGAFIADPNICICMEYMNKGSLESIYKRHGPIPIDVVAKIAFGVLEGLIYLYDVHRIIHRDIKPSNMLLNSEGQIKICDFGVSGELINSIADTFVGTSTYMSPERIQGAQYTVKSDVWSVGISLIELALGRFPFSDDDPDEREELGRLAEEEEGDDLNTTLAPSRPPTLPSKGLKTPTSSTSGASSANKTPKKDKRKSRGVSLQGGGMTMSILELLQHIVNEPAPRLVPEERFPKSSREFMGWCLEKDPEKRLAPKELVKHEWIQEVKAKGDAVDLKAWAETV